MRYTIAHIPEEYSRDWMYSELKKIQDAILELESNRIKLIPSHAAPIRPREGDVVNADGSDWNPGSGAGLYEYKGAAWSKL